MRAREPVAVWRVDEIGNALDRTDGGCGVTSSWSVTLRFVVAILLISGVASAQTSSTAASASGKAIYEQRCVQCHGADGDRSRAVAPLVPAQDAVVFRTDGQSAEDVVEQILRLIAERAA